jgi:predicted NBD/HSP70 family sugar kinase
MPRLSRPQSRQFELLRAIHTSGAVSKGDLAARTGYSHFLISKLTDSLLRSGLLAETGTGASTGGRPPALLEVSPSLGRLVGLHVGAVNCRIAITDLNGKLLHYRKAPSRALEGPEVSLPYLVDEVRRSLAACRVPRRALRGIGIGISGILDRRSGTTLLWPRAPRWRNVPVRRHFEDAFGVEISVDDTPRTLAMAEKRWGSGRNASSFVFVMVGAGVGAALHLNGEWYSGAGGFAGEFGHVTIAENGPLCACGNRGCLEALVSANALIRRAQGAVRQAAAIPLWSLCQGDPARVSVELIAQAAAAGDRFCAEELHRCGRYLGIGVAGLINLLNPGLVILGGGVAQAGGALLVETVKRVIDQRALSQPAAQAEVRLSQLDEPAWARGAALQVAGRALEKAFADATPAKAPAA